MFSHRDGFSQVMCSAFFQQTQCLLVLPKQLHFCLIRPENVFHMLHLCCLIPFTQLWLPYFHTAMKAWLMECCTECPTGSLISAQDFWSTFRVTIGFLTSMTKTLIFWTTANSRKVLGCAKLPPFQNYWGYCSSWNTQSFIYCFISLSWSMFCHNLIAYIHRQFIGLKGLVFVLTMQCKMWALSKLCPNKPDHSLECHSKGSEYFCE